MAKERNLTKSMIVMLLIITALIFVSCTQETVHISTLQNNNIEIVKVVPNGSILKVIYWDMNDTIKKEINIDRCYLKELQAINSN